MLPMPGSIAAVCAPLLAEVKVEQGDWRWAHLPAPWVLTVLVLGLLVAARWVYARERGSASPGRRLLLAGLRVAALLLVVLLIAGPYREEVRSAEEKSHLVVLVDTSASMKNEDAYPPDEEARLLAAAWPEGDEASRPGSLAAAPDASRLGLTTRVLTAQGGAVLRRLAERFVLHVFAFDEDWRSLGGTEVLADERRGRPANEGAEDPLAALVRALSAQTPSGPRTRIGVALRNVATQFLGRPDQRLAGVVLITDGQDTSEGEPPLEVVTGLSGARQLHVVAVGLGNPDSDKNLRVEPIRAKDVVLLHDTVLFETDLRHKGLTGVGPVSARLGDEQIADAEGRPMPPRPIDLPDGDGTRARVEAAALPVESEALPVALAARFDEPGTYRVSITAALPESRQREDAILDDNVATHELRVVDTSIRVLFVDREARWDWRFLSNYLTREAPPRAGTLGAPPRNRFLTHVLLQRGDPTVEMPYTRDSDRRMKPRRSFPTTREDLFAYDVLILGDVDLAALAGGPARKDEVLRLIRAFVEEGGGIALQAGVDLRNPLDMLGTPLADLLPLAATAADEKATETSFRPMNGSADRPFRMRLTEAGRVHPAFNILPPDAEGEPLSPERVARIWAHEDERVSLSERWLWYWAYRCLGGLRPGAVALATAFRPGSPDARDLLDGRDEPLVLCATKSFGKGRVFWTGIDYLAPLRAGHGDTYYGAFWEQVVRDLATYRLLGGNKRFKIFPKDEEVPVGETAEILITALDERFQPLDAPFLDGVHVELPDDGGRLNLEGESRPARPEGGAAGEYSFSVPVTRPGTYLVWIEQRGDGRGEGRDAGGERAERRFRGVTRAREDALRLPNHQVLAALARETDGQVTRLSALGELSLPAQTVSRVLNRERRTQWDKSWVLILLTLVLGLEWALRKRWK